MRFGYLAAALILLAADGVWAAPSGSETWLGAWGWPATPQAPGRPDPNTTPPTPMPPPVPASLLPVTDAAPVKVPVVPANQTPDLDNVTVRQIVRVSVAGSRLRLRFSNEGGFDPLPLGTVHVAEAGEDGAIVPGTDHVVHFDGGNSSFTIPQGSPYYSDPIDMKISALERLAVSIYVPGPLAKNFHSTWNYVSAFGNRAGETQLTDVRLIRSAAYVTGVEVVPTMARNVVVTLGDSITEGALSSANAFKGWPDRLAERLAADRAGRGWSVVNAGIGGNRLLHNMAGPSALARLDRDVLSVPGIHKIILLEGINDIGRPFQGGFAFEGPLAVEQLIAVDRQIIARAHARGIQVIGATLTPFEGAHYYDPKGEVMRSALNAWIRSGGAFDGVIDFDAAVRDPAHPIAIKPGFNKYDHLHPNDAGYEAMAAAIDLGLITGVHTAKIAQEKRHEASANRAHHGHDRRTVAERRPDSKRMVAKPR